MANWRFMGFFSLVQWMSFRFLPGKRNRARTGYHEVDHEVYHERQHRRLCLLHDLNNLLQGEGAFTRRELNEIADRVHSKSRGLQDTKPWLRPYAMIQTRIQKLHRHLLGDYDANVLTAALETRNKELKWMKHATNHSSDKPHGDNELPSMASYGDRFVGIILNSRLNKTRHWAAMRMVQGRWYNLDSLLDRPLRLHGEEGLKAEMAAALANTGHVLIVLEKDGDGDDGNTLID